ncbi:MAG: TrkH family potassium uptake protein [Firmicutes bacterium]|nr:TrkH family potassium uptake protein [Bacillota bacterium]
MKTTKTNNLNFGTLVGILGIILLLPMLVLPFFRQEAKYWFAFLLPGLGMIACGFLVWLLTKQIKPKPVRATMATKMGALVVLALWVCSFLIGALPFVLGLKMSFLHALFESVSGWTTTGFSVLNVDTVPNIFLFHRSLMQFFGGLGFVIVILSFVKGKQAMLLYSAEGHSDSHIMPNLKRMVRTIFVAYVGLICVDALLLWACGVPVFDAINLSICTLATGGFALKSTSLLTYGVWAQGVTCLFMLVGMTPFAALLLLAKGKFAKFFGLSEIRLMGVLLIGGALCCGLVLLQSMTASVAFGSSVFGVMSAMSTTGFVVQKVQDLPYFLQGVMLVAMLIGGCVGSTAGGLKLNRFYLLLRIGLISIKKKLVPARRVESLHYTRVQGEQDIDESVVMDTTGFVILYFLVFAVGAMILVATSQRGVFEGIFEFASALSGAGFSVGIAGPTASTGTLWVLMMGMFLGRLEIYIVLIGAITFLGLCKSGTYKVAKAVVQ